VRPDGWIIRDHAFSGIRSSMNNRTTRWMAYVIPFLVLLVCLPGRHVSAEEFQRSALKLVVLALALHVALRSGLPYLLRADPAAAKSSAAQYDSTSQTARSCSGIVICAAVICLALGLISVTLAKSHTLSLGTLAFLATAIQQCTLLGFVFYVTRSVQTGKPGGIRSCSLIGIGALAVAFALTRDVVYQSVSPSSLHADRANVVYALPVVLCALIAIWRSRHNRSGRFP
jgi:hypothetical protein